MARRASGSAANAEGFAPTGRCARTTCGKLLFNAPQFCPFCGSEQPTRKRVAEGLREPSAPFMERAEEEVLAPVADILVEPPRPDATITERIEPEDPADSRIDGRKAPFQPDRTSATMPAKPSPETQDPTSDPRERPESEPVAEVRRQVETGVRKRRIGPAAIAGLVVVLVVVAVAALHPHGGDGAVAYYATRDAAVRKGPSVNTDRIDTLGAGGQVSGSWVKREAGQAGWLKVSSGKFAGGYVWGGNLTQLNPQSPQDTPSFNCGRVVSANLKLVCSTPSLSAKDRDLAAAYVAAMKRTNDQEGLKRAERDWIRARNNARGDVDGIATLYDRRIAELNALP